MKLIEMKKLSKKKIESGASALETVIEFTPTNKRIMKVKIAATVIFQTEDDEVVAFFSGKEDDLIIQVLLKKLTFRDFHLENIDELSKTS